MNRHLPPQSTEQAEPHAQRHFWLQHTDKWQEIASGIRLHRSLTRWTVANSVGQVPLTRQETEILATLLVSSGRAVAASDLACCAGLTKPLSQNALQVAVRRLRAKVETDPGHPRHLLTVIRHGYVWRP